MNDLSPIRPEAEPIPAFTGQVPGDLRQAIGRAVDAWLLRTPSPHTRRAYELDLDQFLAASGIQPDTWEDLAAIRPEHVSQWRERLAAAGQTNSTIRRKLTALRSLFSYLQTYGYSGANPAHGRFVKAPAVPRDGKTVALSPHDCRRLLDAPEGKPERARPVDIRDRAMLAVLAYSGCRVGELVRLRVRDYKQSGEHRNRFDRPGKDERGAFPGDRPSDGNSDRPVGAQDVQFNRDAEAGSGCEAGSPGGTGARGRSVIRRRPASSSIAPKVRSKRWTISPSEAQSRLAVK
jgi:Phage integrase, N-terminal SAM-like domain